MTGRIAALLGLAALLVTLGITLQSPLTAAFGASNPCPPSPVWTVDGFGNLIEYSPSGAELSRVATRTSSGVMAIFGDIAWSADASTLYGVSDTHLDTINPLTGVVTQGPALTTNGITFIANALTATPDGKLYTAPVKGARVYILDPATGVATHFTDFPTGYVSAGDFLTLPDGDILAVAASMNDNGTTTLFRLHPDGTMTPVGTVPETYGAAQSGGQIFLAGKDGVLRVLSAVPTANSTAPLTTSTIAAIGPEVGANPRQEYWGATSTQDTGCSIGLTMKVGSITDVNNNGIIDAGDQLNYVYDVTNTGTSALTNVTVNDGLVGPATCPKTTLVPGETMTCTAGSPYTITQADVTAGTVVDHASTTGTTPAGAQLLAGADATTTTQVGISLVGTPVASPWMAAVAVGVGGLVFGLIRRRRTPPTLG